ncbi:antirestriction protein ArdA [Caulobacter flavus]|uniref:Antirestriction protein ArdA n=1 Tax=Caulobacter flavus TaxID=1679497 RepID=A0A2N5CQA9_9CAUL|nr:antirestriction protein ArdA [Caulobacter flavus]AYV46280.1 antirestriction protein ArdA [Caulobacter flavus]PLR10000.1 antirestriction protein ArdA [Caulobacter flavus]
MAKAGETLEPCIYVACLAAYNAGFLHGVWIEVEDDGDAVWAAIKAMLQASPIPMAEEYAIHDYEDFGGLEIAEYASIEKVIAIGAFLRERGKLGAMLAAHFGGDIEQAGEALEDSYRGVFESLADCFQAFTEETTTIPENLRLYIDYEAMARDAELSGDVFTIKTAHDEVHVFWGR